MKPTPLLLLLALTLAGCRADEPAPLGRLAFIRNDSLYLQSLPDGRAHLLLAGRGLTQPRWAPSGQWVASRVGSGLRITRVDGNGGQDLAKEVADFTWAPTDDRLAYVAEGNLVVARAGGIAVVLVEKTRAASVQGVAWSADGAWLAYTTGSPGGGGATARAGVWRMAARGGQAVPVALPAIPFAGTPLLRGWTADGRVLALLPPLDSAPAAGAPLFALGGPAGPILLTGPVRSDPGQVAPGPVGRPVTAIQQDGPVLLLASGGAAARRGSTAGAPALAHAWSPDGRRLAWAELPAAPSGPGAARILLADVDSAGAVGAPRPLGGPPGRQELPRWAADGRHLLYVLVDSAGVASVWLSRDGAAPRRVLDVLASPAGAGSPDGNRGRVAWAGILDYWPGPPRRAP